MSRDPRRCRCPAGSPRLASRNVAGRNDDRRYDGRPRHDERNDDVCPAMMWELDTKRRGQMLQIQGKMPQEMGAPMAKRGKEIEQGR
jgi:hypothetical protein